MTSIKQNISHEVIAGQAAYSKPLLSVYDIWVLGISNSWIWKCPSKLIEEYFNKHLSNNHLDVGVGTGYFLEKCLTSKSERVALMDMNPNSVNSAAHRIKAYTPECYLQNILDSIQTPIKPFDSISINYLLHCLPGNIQQKSVVFDNLIPFMKNDATLFGSTILQGDARRGKFAQQLMNLYNKKGIFSNTQDTEIDLRKSLAQRFSKYEVEMNGCVALFWAKNPK